jgi:hypothetical protein
MPLKTHLVQEVEPVVCEWGSYKRGVRAEPEYTRPIVLEHRHNSFGCSSPIGLGRGTLSNGIANNSAHDTCNKAIHCLGEMAIKAIRQSGQTVRSTATAQDPGCHRQRQQRHPYQSLPSLPAAASEAACNKISIASLRRWPEGCAAERPW